MAGFVESIKNEWGVVTAAPWSAAIIAAASFSTSFVALRWYYEGEILHLQTEMGELKERSKVPADASSGARQVMFAYEQRPMPKAPDGQFVTRIILRPQRPYQKVALLITCDSEISEGRFETNPVSGVLFNRSGSLAPDRHSYIFQFTMPAPDATAIIVNLISKEDLRVIRVEGGGL